MSRMMFFSRSPSSCRSKSLLSYHSPRICSQSTSMLLYPLIITSFGEFNSSNDHLSTGSPRISWVHWSSQQNCRLLTRAPHWKKGENIKSCSSRLAELQCFFSSVFMENKTSDCFFGGFQTLMWRSGRKAWLNLQFHAHFSGGHVIFG